MTKLKVNTETGELLPNEVMVFTEKAPAIVIDINEVAVYHKEPEKLAEKIKDQAGFSVFDISTQKGRDACRSHAANIIKCIAPALKASTALAETAKQVVKQDLHFRKVFEEKVREIAEFHRRPLTEYEEEQERIKELERIESERIESERKYFSDWDDALAFNELFDLRKQKEEAESDRQRLAIEADLMAKKLWAKEYADGYQFLFADMKELVTLPMDDFQLKIKTRVITHQEQERIKAVAAAKAQAEREERIRKEAEEKAIREAAQREEQIKLDAAKAERERIAAEQAANKMAEEQAKADQAYREKLERENQEALEHAAQKANEKRIVDNVDTSEQSICDQAPIVQTVDVKPAKEPNQPIHIDALVSGNEAPKTFRNKAINIIAEHWELEYDTAEQWLIKEFSI